MKIMKNQAVGLHLFILLKIYEMNLLRNMVQKPLGIQYKV